MSFYTHPLVFDLVLYLEHRNLCPHSYWQMNWNHLVNEVNLAFSTISKPSDVHHTSPCTLLTALCTRWTICQHYFCLYCIVHHWSSQKTKDNTLASQTFASIDSLPSPSWTSPFLKSIIIFNKIIEKLPNYGILSLIYDFSGLRLILFHIMTQKLLTIVL